jgi:homoserine kinase
MLIPLFREAKSSAKELGALGCSISGSGPSIFTLSSTLDIAEKVADEFKNLYKNNDIEANVYISAVNPRGAEVKE